MRTMKAKVKTVYKYRCCNKLYMNKWDCAMWCWDVSGIPTIVVAVANIRRVTRDYLSFFSASIASAASGSSVSIPAALAAESNSLSLATNTKRSPTDCFTDFAAAM